MKCFKKSRKWKGNTGNLYTVFDCYDSGDDGQKQINQGISLFAKKKYFFIVALIGAIVSLTYAYFSVNSLISGDDHKNIVRSSVSSNIYKSKVITYVAPADGNSTFHYSDRFELLKHHKEHNSIVSDFVIVNCIYDVKRGLYIFDNRVLTQKNFESLNDLFLLEILDTQLISENVYRYEYLVNSEIAFLLTSKQATKKKKEFMK